MKDITRNMLGLLVIGIADVAVGGGGGGKLIGGFQILALDSEFGELLVEGIAIDPQPRRGLDLHTFARLEDLVDQLTFHLSDDPGVKVVRGGAGGADALADKLGRQPLNVTASGTNGAWGGFASKLRG